MVDTDIQYLADAKNHSWLENTTGIRASFMPYFQNTLFNWSPCIYLLVFTPFYIFWLWRQEKSRIPSTILNILKCVLSLLFALSLFAELAMVLSANARIQKSNPLDVASSLALIACSVLAALVVQLERRKGKRTSGLLCVFWLIVLLTEMNQSRNEVAFLRENGSPENVVEFVFVAVRLAIASVLLILHLFVVDKAPKGSLSRHRQAFPQLNASLVSRLFFVWAWGLVRTAHRNKLETSMLWILPRRLHCRPNALRFLNYWSREILGIRRKNALSQEKSQDDPYVPLVNEDGNKNLAKISLVRAIVASFKYQIFVAVILRLAMLIVSFISPLLLRRFLSFVQDQTSPNWNGYMLAFSMFVASVVQIVLGEHYCVINFDMGAMVKSTLMSAIYRKSLRLSSQSRMASSSGEIVNLMAVDAGRYAFCQFTIHFLMLAPFQFVFALYFLWGLLGPSGSAAILAIIAFIPINMLIVRATKKLEVKHMKMKDERMKMMNEVLNGIKVLKLYAWETSFGEKIGKLRDAELAIMKKIVVLRFCSAVVGPLTTCAMTVATFGTYLLSSADHVLDVEKAFVTLSYLNLLRGPLEALPHCIGHLIQVYISHKRISTFLKRDELDFTKVKTDHTNSELTLSIENGNFSWASNTEPTLKSIDLAIKPGSLVAVVGQVGAGKSSLLSALLGEMDTKSGEVSVKGSVAYVPQQPWIQHATLKNNILFFNKCDEKFYNKVIDCCGLRPDLKILPKGDLSEIGEKGINLSGGQKSRVSLARAVYSMSDVYLLDDPLSAVDVHVGKHIFNNIIGPSGLLQNKTRILVTHGIAYLKKVDKIIVLNDGCISEMGTYQSLVENDGAFARFLESHKIDLTDEADEIDNSPNDTSSKNFDLSQQVSCINLEDTDTERKKSIKFHEDKDDDLTDNMQSCEEGSKVANSGHDEKDGLLVDEEFAETGNVKFTVVKSYLQAIGWWGCIIFLCFSFLNNAVTMCSSVWLAQWSDAPKQTFNVTMSASNSTDSAPVSIHVRLIVLGLLGLAEALFCGIGRFAGFIVGIRTSRIQHQNLLHGILAAAMSFFDRTPVGRLLNRFGNDIQTMDSELPDLFMGVVGRILHAFVIVIVVSSITPWSIIVWIILAVVYVVTQRFYVSTSRQLQRLMSICNSPIFAQFSETIAGLSTIRAYRRQRELIQESERRIDEHNKAFVPFYITQRILSTNTLGLGSLVVLAAACLAVSSRDNLSVGLIALSVTQAINITGSLCDLVHRLAHLENGLVSAERIKECIDTAPEAPRTIAHARPEQQWPQSGRIEIKDYSTRYREGLDLVLKGFSIKIEAGEKVGIVGRTGAGKSSLTLALFRIIEAVEGAIIIDGIDVSKIGLHDLRAKITIIPQDPVLFSGSLRMNLDPFDKHTDEQLWSALEKAHLKSFAEKLEGGLMFECSEGGENISVGQRQLICLARALLRKTKVLVMDEATAAVDLETDELIQTTIRQTFADSTVLTIAHRLHTVLDYTKIMVLDTGRVAEYDSPSALLADKNSIFYEMVNGSSNKSR